MNILFMMKHPGTTRNFEPTLRLLVERGHHVHLAFDAGDDTGAADLVRRLEHDYTDRLTSGRGPKSSGNPWGALTRELRLGIDYLRYLHPRYRGAEKLRARARDQAPPAVVAIAGLPLMRSRLGVRAIAGLLGWLERAMPASDVVRRYIRDRGPDLVLVSPLVGLGSYQADYIRAARSLGIPSGLLVFSWDNLTNKGRVRESPDLVAVWNEAQAVEATELHGVPRDRVAVTGAPGFDRWFVQEPSRDRVTFCEEVGLRAEQPILLYVGSSAFIAPDEVSFVRRWSEALRGSPVADLREAGILIRPHPQNAKQWRDADFGDDQVAIWPRGGANPVDDAARNDYFDSLHHCAAVVGINTSALIESAIVNRPVFTVLDPDFAGTQEGTLHFHYLSDDGAGVLHTAATLDEHLEQLQLVLGAHPNWEERNRRFVASFVRPGGLDRPAAPLLADAIEGAARVQVAPARRRRGALRRALLKPFALRAESRKAAASRRAKERKAERLARAGDPIGDARRLVADLAAGPESVLAGPWYSEVGYELLYWMPFLTWAMEQHPDLATRTTVVSRGGVGHWYSNAGASYHDLFDHHRPEQLLERTSAAARVATGGLRKQMSVTDLDRDLLADVARRRGLDRFGVLHPSAMYNAYWRLVKLRELVLAGGPELFSYRPLPQPDAIALEDVLPRDFVAVRFYFRASFPETPENAAFVRRTLEELAAETHVVLLNTPIRFDDHHDHAGIESDRVVQLAPLMTATNNLALQTIAVSRARAFVGTYGGLAYLAPYFGVPSLSFHSVEGRFRPHHLDLASTVFGSDGFGDFSVRAVGDLESVVPMAGA